uniref:Uncharacterized protein n=1 Tax=Streptomyces phage Scarif TaxID=3158858 RepID=A0AAU7GXK1_9CAUD
MCPVIITYFRIEGIARMSKTKNNCCPRCNQTHEKCADSKRCEKWEISRHVCIIFGTRPLRITRRS